MIILIKFCTYILVASIQIFLKS